MAGGGGRGVAGAVAGAAVGPNNAQHQVLIDGIHLFHIRDAQPDRGDFEADLDHHFALRHLTVIAIVIPSGRGHLRSAARVTFQTAADATAALLHTGRALDRRPGSRFAGMPNHPLTISAPGDGALFSRNRNANRAQRRAQQQQASGGGGAGGGGGGGGGGRGRGRGRGGGAAGRGGGGAGGGGAGRGRGGGARGGGGRGRGRGRGAAAQGPQLPPLPPPPPGPVVANALDDIHGTWGYAPSGQRTRLNATLDGGVEAAERAGRTGNSVAPPAALASAETSLRQLRRANLLGDERLVKRPAPNQRQADIADPGTRQTLQASDLSKGVAAVAQVVGLLDQAMQPPQAGLLRPQETAEGHAALELLGGTMHNVAQLLGRPVDQALFPPPANQLLPSLIPGPVPANAAPAGPAPDSAEPFGVPSVTSVAKAANELPFFVVRPEETPIVSEILLLWSDADFVAALAELRDLFDNQRQLLAQVCEARQLETLETLLELGALMGGPAAVLRSEQLAFVVQRNLRLGHGAGQNALAGDKGGDLMEAAFSCAFEVCEDVAASGQLGQAAEARLEQLRDALPRVRLGERFQCSDCTGDWQEVGEEWRHTLHIAQVANSRSLGTLLQLLGGRPRRANYACANCGSVAQRRLRWHVLEIHGDSLYLSFAGYPTQQRQRLTHEEHALVLEDELVPSRDGFFHLRLAQGLRLATATGLAFTAGRDPDAPVSSAIVSIDPQNQRYQARHRDFEPTEVDRNEVEEFLRYPTPRLLDNGPSKASQRDRRHRGTATGQARVSLLRYSLPVFGLPNYAKTQNMVGGLYPSILHDPQAHPARLLGCGATGVLFAVHVNGNFAALKLQDSGTALLREARALRSASLGPGQPFFPAYLDCVELRGTPAHLDALVQQSPLRAGPKLGLLMELLPLGTLEDRQRREKRALIQATPAARNWNGDQLGQAANSMIDDAEFLEFVKAAYSALDHLHTQVGFIHRDIKPGNIGIRTDAGGAERLVLLDLGLVGKIWAGPAGEEGLRTDAGNLRFRAPEAFERDTVAASDIWSVAAVLASAVSYGVQHPFFGDHARGLRTAADGSLLAQSRQDIQGQADLPAALSRASQRLLDRLLHYDPQQRPTAQDVLQDANVRNAY